MTGRCALSVVVVMSSLQLPVFAAETLFTEVTVRVYDNTGATDAERRPSLTVAASIVSAASVELLWKTCTEPAAGVAIRRATRACLRDAARTGRARGPDHPLRRRCRWHATDAATRRRDDQLTDRDRCARDDLHRSRQLDGRTDRRRRARAARACHRARTGASADGDAGTWSERPDAPGVVAVGDPSSSDATTGSSGRARSLRSERGRTRF